MRIIFTIFLISALSVVAFAKKVKFMVDMDTITINVNGVHVVGDFQDEAGMGPDWADPATIQMTPEVSDPSIYSVVVNIPAFRHYEFKFMNGIYGYEAEFVPQPSRVGYQFNDNRWIYIDSLANDTQVVKPVIFATNAPAGKYLLRFKVDMMNVLPASPGTHLMGNFQGWDPASTYMYNFGGGFVHEFITYVDTGAPAFQHEFSYINGNLVSGQESVPLACANGNGNRSVYVSSDSVLAVVCFASCSPCAGSAISEIDEQPFTIYPNPSKGEFKVQGLKFKVDAIRIYNVFGKLVSERTSTAESGTLSLDVPGIYFLKMEGNRQTFSEKLVVE